MTTNGDDAFAIRYGPWALVAGASEGIGASFARQIADAGINVVLVARRTEPLEATADAIRATSAVDVRTVPLDLTADDMIDRLRSATEDLDIGLLVYNAGATHGAVRFHDESVDLPLRLVRLNCVGPVLMCHYFGGRMAERARALGVSLLRDAHSVWGLRRRTDRLPAGLAPVAADLTDPSSLTAVPTDLDYVFFLSSAARRDDASYKLAYVDGLRNLLARLDGSPPKRLFVASSTRVYPQSGGVRVDELSATAAWHFTSRRLLESERLAAASSIATTIVRFGGIYGPGRTGLVRRVLAREATLWDGSPHFTNRIHRDDCAAVLAHLMGLDSPESLYLAVDDTPVKHNELVSWIADRLGVDLPATLLAPGPTPSRSRTEGKRPQTNKRCSNARLRASGYRCLYPSFREGYEELISAFGALHPH